MTPIADTAGVRAGNTARVLREVRAHGQTTRVDLASALNLSPATVTAVVGALLESGLVLEERAASSPGRGRPRVLISLNPDARYVAGAKLNDGSLTTAILNFKGEILAEAAAPFDQPTIDGDLLRAKVDEALDAALCIAGLTENQIDAYGLGVPGFVETESGLCHWSPVLSVEDKAVDVGAMLRERLSCPTFVDNDANLVALAELWFGLGNEEQNFLVVTVEHGVGLGIVMDGRLYRGGRGLGAEFGHTKVQIDGALCRCGQRGCLEAYVADFALRREAGAALEGDSTGLSRSEILDRLAAEARAGKDIPASIYRRAGRMLGLGLANLTNLFDPALIVLAGERIRNHKLLAEEVEKTLRENAIVINRESTPLTVHRWGDGLWARGAGALALDGLMSQADLQVQKVA